MVLSTLPFFNATLAQYNNESMAGFIGQYFKSNNVFWIHDQVSQDNCFMYLA